MKSPVRGFAAVRHVVAKDLRRHRIALAGYGAFVAAAAGSGFSGVALPDIAPIAVLLLGMVVAVLLVHGDPPFRSRAFWALHPIAPGAVYGAKLVLVFGGILGTALVGQGAVLVGFGVPFGEIPGLLLASTPSAGSLLLAGVLLAVSFRTLAGVAAAVAMGIVLLPLLSGVLFFLLMMGILIPVTPMGASLVWGGAVVGGLIWAGRWYATPDGSWTGRVLGPLLALTVAVGGVATGTTGGGAPGVHADELVAAHPSLEGVSIELLSVTGRGSGSDGPHLDVGARVHGPDRSAVYRIRPESARLILSDGTSQNLVVDSRRTNRHDLSPDAAQEWIGQAPSISHGDEVRIRPDPTQWEALHAGGATVEVSALVERLESREVGTMRLGAGSSMASGGTRIRQVEPGAREPGAVDLYEVTIGSGPVGPRSRAFDRDLFGSSLVYALLSPGAKEGAALRSRGGSGGGFGPSLFSKAGLLLPGPVVREWSGRWTIQPEVLEELDSQWLDQARLHAFEWVVVGTGRVVSPPVALSVQEGMPGGPPPASRPAIPMPHDTRSDP